MIQALFTSTLMGQEAGATGQTYEIKCTVAENVQLQAATVAQRKIAEDAKAETMAATVAKLVRERVDAGFAEAK
jgi:hypothetical protein